MIQITLKEYAAPGNTEVITNVSNVAGTALSANAPGPSNASQAADLAAAVTAISTAPLFVIVYTDVNGVTQRRVLSTSDIKTFI